MKAAASADWGRGRPFPFQVFNRVAVGWLTVVWAVVAACAPVSRADLFDDLKDPPSRPQSPPPAPVQEESTPPAELPEKPLELPTAPDTAPTPMQPAEKRPMSRSVVPPQRNTKIVKEQPKPLNSAGAKAAIERFERAAETAGKAFEKSTQTLITVVSRELETAQTRALRLNDPDEAVRIREVLKEIKANGGPVNNGSGTAQPGTAAALTNALTDSGWMRNTPGDPSHFIMTFLANGVVKTTNFEHEGTWAAIDGKTVRISISPANCRGGPFTISDDGKTLSSESGTIYTLERMEKKAAPRISTSKPVQSADALSAMDRYTRAHESAQKTFVKALEAAMTPLAREMELAQAKASREKDPDEAIRIRERFESIKAENSAPKQSALAYDAFTRAMIGTSWRRETPGDRMHWVMTFRENGIVTSSHHTLEGTWAAIGGKSVRISIGQRTASGSAFTMSPDGKTLSSDIGTIFVAAGR